jgi:hypothetical protein
MGFLIWRIAVERVKPMALLYPHLAGNAHSYQISPAAASQQDGYILPLP